MGKTRSVWGNYFHLLSFKIEQNDEEKKPQYLKHLFLHPSLLPGLSFSPTFCPSGTGGQGMDSAVSLLHSQVIPHCLCCCFLLCGSTPYPLPLLKCVVPPTGDSPSQASPESFLRAPVLQEPLQHGCPVVSQVLVLHGLLSPWTQFLPGPCSSTSFPEGHSLLQASTCSGVGLSMGCRWVSAPPWIFMGSGAQLSHCGLPHSLQGNLSCQAWSISSPSSFLGFDFYIAVSFSLLSQLWLYNRFFSSLKYTAPEALPPVLMDLAY